jgi:hypothetical protein
MQYKSPEGLMRIIAPGAACPHFCSGKNFNITANHEKDTCPR